MKTKIFSIIASAAILSGLASCDSYEPNIKGGKEGKLNTSSIAIEVSNAEKIINDNAASLQGAHSRSVVDLSNYIVTVVDANGEPVNKWIYSEMPELPTFTEGSYTVKVTSGEEPITAAWDAPYFKGEQPFTIKADEITDVATVKCTLANICVTVKFTDELVKASAGDLKVVVRSEGAQSLTYTPDESRSGYFAAVDGLVTLSVAFTGTVSGTDEKFTKVVTDVAAGQHRIITFGLKSNPNQPPVPSGGIDATEGINVSTEVVEEDLTADVPFEDEILDSSDRPGQEGETPNNPDDPNPPVLDNPITFTSALGDLNVDIDAIPEQDIAEFVENKKTADLTITAPAGISSVVVEIVSDNLDVTEVGLVPVFDLANPGPNDPDLANALSNLGFPVKDDVIGKTEISFDITGFVGLLDNFEGKNYFYLTVTDANGATKKTALKFYKR